MKTGRITRIMKILMALQSGRGYSVDDLAKMLGLSRRTVFRDLKELSEAGVPYHYDAKTRTYSIDRHFLLPPLDLTPKETMGLLMIHQKAATHMHLPFNDSALSAALKIESNLSNKTRQYYNAVLRNIYVKARPQTRPDAFDRKFSTLQEAILTRRSTNIRYYLPVERKDIFTDMNPYHMMHHNDSWYVLGKSSFHNSICALKFNQIRELRLLNKYFVEEDRFDLHEYLGRAWSMTPEGRLYNVKLRFMPEVAYDVVSVKWHATQTVAHNDDGSATVEFRVDGLNEITWWILGYGDKVEVLAPSILRQRIVQIAKNMLRVNSNVQQVVEISESSA